MKILLIEENGDLAANVAEFLDLQGHTVVLAHDTPAGLPPDLDAYDACVIGLPLPYSPYASIAAAHQNLGRPVRMVVLDPAIPKYSKMQLVDGIVFLSKPFTLESLSQVLG